MVHSEKFLWPSSNLLSELDMTRVIRLSGLELGMTNNLFEIRLCFTGGLRSPLLRAEGAGIQSAAVLNEKKVYPIDPRKRI